MRDQWFTFGYGFTWTPEANDVARSEQAQAASEAAKDTARITPASWETLLLTSQADEVGDGRVLMLENLSDETVVITSVTLSDCMNVYTKCGRHEMEIVVGPKGKKRVLTVRTSETLANSFSHIFEWHRMEAPKPE